MTAAAADRAARFERLYSTVFPEIAGYVRRRCGGAEADGIPAPGVALAWRRLGHVPPPPLVPPRVFAVAPNTLPPRTPPDGRGPRPPRPHHGPVKGGCPMTTIENAPARGERDSARANPGPPASLPPADSPYARHILREVLAAPA